MIKTDEATHRKKTRILFSLPLLLLFVTGVVVSITSFLLVHKWELTNQRNEFESWVKAYANDVESTLNQYADALLFLGDFYNNSEQVTRQEFNGLVNSILPRYNGVRAFGWDLIVKDDERAFLEATVRKEGNDNFEITERSETNGLIRAERREEYVVVYFIQPLESNRAALGFDIASQATRLEAIIKAFTTGKLVVSEKVSFVQAIDSPSGVLLLLPVYHQGVSLKTSDERRSARKGLLVEVIRIDQVIETALKGFKDVGINLTLYDMSADEENRLLYHRASQMSKVTDHPGTMKDNKRNFHWSQTLDFGNRQWKIEFCPTAFYYQSRKIWQTWIVFFGSMLLTILLVFYMYKKNCYTVEIEKRVFEQAQSNQELKKEKEFIDIVLNSQKDTLFVFNSLTGKPVRWNKSFNSVSGYTNDEISSLKAPESYYYRDDVERARTHIDKVIQGFSGMVELNLQTKDGRSIPTEYSVSMFTDADEKTIHIISVGRDVAERKKTEKRLVESEVRFRTLVENIPGVVFRSELKAPWQLYYVSETAFELTGYLPEQFVENRELNFGDLILAEDLPVVKRIIDENIKNRTHYEVEYRIRHASGDIRWVSEKGRASFDNDGKPTLLDGVIVDVTERKQAEIKLQHYSETLSVLLQEVNHRVKNNLVVIISMLHKEEDCSRNKGQNLLIPILHDLEGRINGLLTVHSMFSATNWQPLFLNELCRQIINEILKLHKMEIELTISESKMLVDSDQAHHLSMVINELATNSLKYAVHRYGQICIDITIKENDGHVFMVFRDNGPGYPDAIINSEHRGSGIGFDLMIGIVTKNLGGKISFKNINGAVTEIEFQKNVTHRG